MIRTKPKWKSLNTLDAWRQELQTLLDEAREVSSQDDFQKRLNVAEYLTGFIQESFPQTEEMDALDALAEQAVEDILLPTIDDRLAAIASRTAEYVAISKSFDAAAEKAEAMAGEIRLQNIKSVIDATTQTIASAKSLADSLDASKADEKEIAALIDKAIKAVEKLRSGVGGLL